MIKPKQILSILETVQEFIGTNPNEVTALADNAVLIEVLQQEHPFLRVICREEEETMTKQTQIVSILETVQEFIGTNPNEVTALADSAVLIEALQAHLNPKGIKEVA